jgi:hypothetical protein
LRKKNRSQTNQQYFYVLKVHNAPPFFYSVIPILSLAIGHGSFKACEANGLILLIKFFGRRLAFCTPHSTFQSSLHHLVSVSPYSSIHLLRSRIPSAPKGGGTLCSVFQGFPLHPISVSRSPAICISVSPTLSFPYALCARRFASFQKVVDL